MSTVSPQPGLDWHGEDVTIEDVLNALNRVRHSFARAEAGEEGQPHPRNCVMTLVSVVADSLKKKSAILARTANAKNQPSLAIGVGDQAMRASRRIDES